MKQRACAKADLYHITVDEQRKSQVNRRECMICSNDVNEARRVCQGRFKWRLILYFYLLGKNEDLVN